MAAARKPNLGAINFETDRPLPFERMAQAHMHLAGEGAPSLPDSRLAA